MKQISGETTLLLAIATELGFMSKLQAEALVERQRRLRRAQIKLPTAQLLLEEQLLTLAQYKTVSDQAELLRVNKHGPTRKLDQPVPFGKFELRGILSENGYTRVFKAHDTEADRITVLKILPPALSHDSQWVARFRREMFIVANISHPNIIHVHECGSVGNEAFIAFEYLEGASVSHLLERRGNLPERTTWLIVREVAKGLSCLEDHGVQHRDIKPENILCGNNGQVTLIDLGLSRSMLDNAMITACGQTVGTPFYMSPEQALGTTGLDHRVDIYSLGCVAYQMLTGSVPFFADDATTVMHKHVSSPRPNPRDVVPELHSDSADTVKWMMAANRDDRPKTALTLIETLDNLLSKLPESAQDAGMLLKIIPSEPPV